MTQGDINKLETELEAIREALLRNLEEHRRLLKQQSEIIKILKGF